MFVLIKTSSEDEDERRLQDVFIKTNVCWAKGFDLMEKCVFFILIFNLFDNLNIAVILFDQNFTEHFAGTTI